MLVQTPCHPVNFQPLYGLAMRTARDPWIGTLAARHDSAVQRTVQCFPKPVRAFVTLPHPSIPTQTVPPRDRDSERAFDAAPRRTSEATTTAVTIREIVLIVS
jgi:hypothetical protein